MEVLRLSFVQEDLFWEDKQKNLNYFDQKLTTLKEVTDLVILPEMFTTGFSMQAKELAETMDGTTVQWLKKQAARLSSAIMGSCIIVEGDNYYNRLLFVTPEGNIHHYDKRHLFSFAGEHHHYTAGKDRLLIDYQGWKIMPLICYDLRFPVWSRNTDYYDLLIYVANFPDKRRFAWEQLLTARAIENQAYTVGVNRIGKDGKGIEYSGNSQCIDYSGWMLSDAESKSIVKTIELSYSAQQSFRRQFAFLPDRDMFEIKS
jgi:predicted amidohydrolase